MSKRQKQHRSCTAEFRQDAVKLVVEQGYTYPEAAERLDIPFHTLKNWVKHFRKDGTLPPASEPNRESEELKRLRKEVHRLQMEIFSDFCFIRNKCSDFVIIYSPIFLTTTGIVCKRATNKSTRKHNF